jgi:protein SCO1/2
MKHADKDGHAKHKAMLEDSKSEEQTNVDVRLRDLELVTQDGKRVKFKSDVIGDKLVAINFIYTSCTTICPIYNAIFTQLQELLGERQGEEVILISLSIDPARDIPPRMKREAEKFKAKPGWTYLTGKKGTVDEVLRGLDAFYPDYTQHPPMALVGDGKTGTWKRYFGFPPPGHLLTMIDELKAARLAKAE